MLVIRLYDYVTPTMTFHLCLLTWDLSSLGPHMTVAPLILFSYCHLM